MNISCKKYENDMNTFKIKKRKLTMKFPFNTFFEPQLKIDALSFQNKNVL